MRVPARAKKTLDDVDANDANDDETTRMTFDDGRPLIDVSTAMSKASVKRSSSIGPPVARPNVMRSRAATLAALDEAREDERSEEEESDEARRRRERRGRGREGRKKGEFSLDSSDARGVVEWMARSTATTTVRGFAEPAATLVDVPPPPPTSFDLASKKSTTSTTTSTTTTNKARGGLSAALAAADRPTVFDADTDDASRRDRPSSKIDVAALVASVPTSRADVFAHPLDWSVYDAASIDDVAREWISRKLTTLMGESEPALVRFVVDKLGARARPESLVADLEPVLDAETDAFVLGLWRVLIFETKKARRAR